MNDTDELDALYDALTSTVEHVTHTVAPEIRDGVHYSGWGYYHHKRTGTDIAYRNKNGELHRLSGPAYIGLVYNFEMWFKNAKLHRLDGPAITTVDSKYWFVDDKLHRLDGPAVIKKAGPVEYWINGQKLSPREYKKEIDRRKRKGLIDEKPIKGARYKFER